MYKKDCSFKPFCFIKCVTEKRTWVNKLKSPSLLMVFLSIPLNKLPWLNVRDLWETYIIHVFFSFFFTARNLYVTSTIVMDRYALVPALLSRDQADSLLLFAFPFPLFLNMLSMVQRKCLLYINIRWVVEFQVGWWNKSKLSIKEKIHSDSRWKILIVSASFILIFIGLLSFKLGDEIKVCSASKRRYTLILNERYW